MTEKDVKSCFSIKKLISISERRAEHPFAGRNTQHIKVLSTLTKLALITIKTFSQKQLKPMSRKMP